MTSLAYRNGGLIVNLSSGLQTTCDCCEDCACTFAPDYSECDCCAISVDITINDGDYYIYGALNKDQSNFGGDRRDPGIIAWQSGYPEALGCWFWWHNFISCTSTTGSYTYSKVARYYTLFQCENGVLVNRTYDAVASIKFRFFGPVHYPVSLPWGYTFQEVYTQGIPEDDYDDLNGGCMTEVEDIEPPLPELTC